MRSADCSANKRFRRAAAALICIAALLSACGRGGSVTDLGSGVAVIGSPAWVTVPAPQFPELATDDPAAPQTAPGGVYSRDVPVGGDRFYVYPDLSSLSETRDTFLILSFGWGHGVGMSQYGAVGYARQGYDYIQILQHYYTGAAIYAETPPAHVTCEGANVPTDQMVARIVQAEIAGITEFGDEKEAHALRAQAVAAYTNLRYYGNHAEGCAWADSYDDCRSDVKAVAREVTGQYLAYDGKVISALYSACTAGMTAAYIETWGENERDLPYLQRVVSTPDFEYDEFLTVTAVTPEQMRAYIASYDDAIALGSDPADWIEILAHDDAVNEQIGYVLSMRIGDRVIDANAGLTFRDEVMDYDIKAPCFAIVYNGNYL